VLVEPRHLRIGQIREHQHVRRLRRRDAFGVRTAPDHDEALGSACERADHRVDVLVGQQTRDAEVEGLVGILTAQPVEEFGYRLGGAGTRHRDRRRQHVGGDSVGVGDALLNHGRDREVAVARCGGATIPGSQVSRRGGQRGALCQPRVVAEVLVLEVQPSCRRVAVHELAAGGLEPVRPPAGTGHDHVGVDLDGVRGQRQDRQRCAVVLAEEPDAVDAGYANVALSEFRISVRGVVQQCVNRRIRKGAAHR
jgi:hypothetical protein